MEGSGVASEQSASKTFAAIGYVTATRALLIMAELSGDFLVLKLPLPPFKRMAFSSPRCTGKVGIGR